jgi:uracil-DNA glycosylase
MRLLQLDIQASDKLAELCKEVRRCDFCFRNTSVKEKGIPLVYGGREGDKNYDPKVLVVSEMPPSSAWEKREEENREDLGARWAKGQLFAPTKRVPQGGAPETLREWLGKGEDWALSQLFWIQRANCPVESYGVRKRFAFQHCSSRFLDRAVKLVKPELILTLGGEAAEYFIPEKGKLKTLMDSQVRGVPYQYPPHNDKPCDCIVLYHTSRRNKALRQSKLHKASVDLAKRRINELHLGEHLAT